MSGATAAATRPMTFPAGAGERIAITAVTAEALLAAVEARFAAGRGFMVATLNLDHLVKLPRLAAFRAAYLAADFVTADGRPVVWLSRLAGRPVRLAPGSELVAPLCALAARVGTSVALFGSTPETLAIAARRLEAAHPGLRIALVEAPPFGFDPEGPAADACAARIAASGARLCFVALGAPKQEIFAVRALARAPACGFAAVGAGLDFIAGAQTRAPALARALALEWLWRMLSNPRRLAGRYAACALALPRLAQDAARLRARGPRGGRTDQ